MNFQPGDLLIFYGRELPSRIIEWATWGPSHIGIIAERPNRLELPGPRSKAPLLYESTTLCDLPCAITGEKTAGVQAHPPEERIAMYNGRVARLRLTTSWTLHPWESWQLTAELGRLIGEKYDLRDAILSGTRLFKWTQLMPYPDLRSLFCSELCAAMLMRIWRLPMTNPAVYNPASLVRAVRRCGTYGAPTWLKPTMRETANAA